MNAMIKLQRDEKAAKIVLRPFRWRCTRCGRIGHIVVREDDPLDEIKFRTMILHKVSRPRSGTVATRCDSPTFTYSKARKHDGQD